jgi:hypothetical protein
VGYVVNASPRAGEWIDEQNIDADSGTAGSR